MIKRLTTLIAAGAIAATGAASPAVAQSDEELLGRILLGAAVLGIGAKIIDDRKDKKRREEARRREAEVARATGEGRTGVWTHRDQSVIEGEVLRPGARGPKAGRGYKRDPLPARCRVTVATNRGERPGYGSRCLEQRFKQARHLPRQCEVLVDTSAGLRAVYGERCLDRDGWQTPRSH